MGMGMGQEKEQYPGLPCPEYKYRTISVNTSFVVSWMTTLKGELESL